MFTEEEVLHILLDQLSIERDTKKGKLPDYYPGYIAMVEDSERLRIHYDMDTKPVKLFEKKAPNQQPEQRAYALDNYRPATVPFWGSAENSINRIWNRDNFTFDFKPDATKFEDHPAEQYFLKDIPFYKSIFTYFAGVTTKWKIRDPNAVIVSKPADIPFKLDENQDLIVDESQLIRPIPVIYRIRQVISYREEVHALIQLFEKSIIKDGNIRVRNGLIYEFYDKDTIYRVTQIRKMTGNKFQAGDFRVDIYWQHNLGFLPVTKLRGLPQQFDDISIYESHFKPALPNLDDALIHNSNLQLSIISQVYPHMWQIVDKCTCKDGQMKNPKDEGGTWIDCDKCDGGRKGPSPTSIFTVRLPGKLDGDAQVPPTPPFGFVSPDIGVLEFLDKKVKTLIIDAFSFMNINVAQDATFVSGTGTQKTATEMIVNREEFFSFLTVFSKEIFDTLNFTIKSMGKMRYGVEWEPPVIIEPVNFSLRTFEDLVQEIKIAKDAGIPDIFTIKLLEEFAKVRFNTDVEFATLMEFATRVDNLLTKTDMEISIGIGNKTISKEEVALHNNLVMIVEQEMAARIDKKESFFDLPFEEQKRIVIERAKNMVVAETVTDQVRNDLGLPA